ncbi:uncharacterized protein LOC128127837 [Lactuca sativa]|uniref:uncharacterized protein LOC128127837 n=1 Tax=Lactuca sativa TaxID=4236 RepID=UPI0022B03DB5|nr:uncharacterized protein LOC128127837 [Lactuca sativa]
MVSFIYGRAKSTTSRCFHRVLRAVVALESYYIQQPKGDVVPKEIQEKKRFYPYFKNCVGAIDGTHVRVKVPNRDAPRYRGRKGYPNINVLAACSFDLKFTYVLTDWEGTASDSRIVKDALKRDDKLLIPRGRYCLVDVGLPHTIELMTPYRGVRYHLKECSAHPPVNAKELFNLRHASLRNAIERSFGVLKRRFPITRIMIKKLEHEVLQEVLDEQPQQVRHDVNNGSVLSDGAEEFRNTITTQMWNDYLLKPNNEIDIAIMNKRAADGSVVKKENLTSTDHMDNALVEALVKEDDIGKRVNGTFTSQAYANMIAGLSKEFNKSITKDQLKNRMKTLKGNFSKWYDMYRDTLLSGFSWNSQTKHIEAEEEVWEKLIKTNLEVAAFRTKKFSNYSQLEMLFSDDRALGSKAETTKEKNVRLSKSKEIKIEKIADVEKLMANKEVSLENVHKDDDEDIQIVSATYVSPDGSSKAKKLKSKKRKLESKLQDEDEVVAETEPEPEPEPQPESFEHNIVQTFKEIVDVMREGNKSRDYTGEEIEKELELMGLDDNEFADAFIYLSRIQAIARTIFSSSMKMRKIFLRKMMSEAKK